MESSTLEQVIRQLEDFVLEEHDLDRTGRLPFEHQGKTEYGYPYIRSSHLAFEAALAACLRLFTQPASEIRFLEVGSGLGTKCEIARLHGTSASGLDLNPQYVELARKVFWSCEFFEANALDFDYRQFDLVYYHTPFFEDSLLCQLERRILTQLPVPSVLFVTRLSESLQSSLGDQGDTELSWLRLPPVPENEIGRIRIIQKQAPTVANSLESCAEKQPD